MRISVIGTGIYGISLALQIALNKHEVIMWSENKTLVENFKKKHSLEPITDIVIPKNINVTCDLELAIKDVDLIFIATSAKYLKETCLNMLSFYDKKIPIVIASKGILNDTCCFLSDILKNTLKAKNIGVISGPTFAADLLNKEVAALSIATTKRCVKDKVNQALGSSTLKLRWNNDIYGTQICGSIKNVIAIASGIIEGLGYSDSTRAFLLTEALHDIKDLLLKLECNPKTILSYAGVGDLILTATSVKSRNYRYGILLGKKVAKKEIANYLEENTTEGYYTLIAIRELLKRRKIKMPIIDILYDIAIKGKDAETLIQFLINKK